MKTRVLTNQTLGLKRRSIISSFALATGSLWLGFGTGPRKGLARSITIDFGRQISLDELDALSSGFMKVDAFKKLKKQFISQGDLVEAGFSLSGSKLKINLWHPSLCAFHKWQSRLSEEEIFNTKNLRHLVHVDIREELWSI